MKVSICVATYNGEKYIYEQMASILPQISVNDEVVVSDDNSEDKTLKIIQSFNDERIKVLLNKRSGSNRLSLVSNFENALINSTGDAIFLSDQDDIWLEGRVQRVLELLGTYDLVVSDCRVVDENLNVICDSFFDLRKSGPGLIRNFYKNTYIGCCMAFTRRICDLVLPFPRDIPMHDWWVGSIAELYGRVHFLNEKLLLYRRHGDNASQSSKKSPNSLSEQISLRSRLLSSLINFHLEVASKNRKIR
jgi:glycosyltransferase involved in cell wall biosynthesis